MQYALLIYGDEAARAQMTPTELEKEMADYNAYTAEVRDRGIYKGGEALLPTDSATTVRIRDGKTLTTDGPFAETKEQLGGFYLLDCKDLDEAIEFAAKLPAFKHGSVEVRPVAVFE